jgi:lysophospholipase L1-like esterase
MQVAPVCALVLSAMSMAQPTYDQVPEVFTQSPEVFARLLASGRCGTVDAIVLGDSQETNPAGQGNVYLPRLHYEFWTRYQNTPATGWIPVGLAFGGGQGAGWLVRASRAAPGPATSRYPAQNVLPLMVPIATSTTDGANINANQRYGGLVMLQHDGADLHAGTQLAGTQEFLTRSASIAMDVMAATNESSGEVALRVTPGPLPSPSYFQPTIQTFTTSMTLERPGPQLVQTQRIGPFSAWNASGYLQVEVSGTDPLRLTDVLSVRFVNLADERGWAITTLSRAGYSSQSVLGLHPGSADVLNAMSPDVVFLTYGANDGDSGITAVAYGQALRSLISFVRAATRTDLPIVLIPDAYRGGLQPFWAEEFDRYPGACYEIAQSDPLVLAINSRRALDAQGWNASGSATFLVDGVHYTALGAITKAATDAALLFSLEAPVLDCNANGTPDACDIASGVSQDLNADGVPDECACDLDYNRDENADLLDAQLLAQVVAGVIQAEPTWLEGDFNADENVDLADAQLLARIAAGIEVCP